MDRRIKNTKEKVRMCFVELLRIKPIDEITVTELCEKRDINRATFYKYYENQYDLLDKLEQDYIREILDDIEKSGSEEFPMLIRPIIEKVKSTQDYFSILISENGDSRFREKVFSLCYKENMKIIDGYFKNCDETQKKWLFYFMGEGLNGIFRRWLADGMKESADDIVKFAKAVVDSVNEGFEKHNG